MQHLAKLRDVLVLRSTLLFVLTQFVGKISHWFCGAGREELPSHLAKLTVFKGQCEAERDVL